MFTILAIIFGILTFSYFWIQKKFKFWTDRGFLQGNPSFPMGTLSGVGQQMTNAEKLDVYYKIFKGKVPAVGLYNFLSPVILVIDPELAKNILVKDFQSFHDRGLFYNKKDDPVGANTLTLNGQEWKDRRQQLTPIFTTGKIKMMFEIIDIIGDKFVKKIELENSKSENLEMRSWLQRFTADNIGNIAFGIEPNCLEDENSTFTYYGNKLVNIDFFGIMRFIFGTEFPNIARKLKLGFTSKEVGDFFLKTFIETIEFREKNQTKRNDLVTLLLGLKDIYTKEELAAEAFLVYMAGFETSSTLMTFTLYELAINPDIQEKLREEITKGMEENGGKLTYDMLNELKYLDMVLNEALRKYPPIPTPIRKCSKDYKIPDTDLVIPEGTLILINAFSIQRDPEYFPDPEKFDPERFNAQNIKDIKPFTNIPFGEGPRMCLGIRFGMMQSKIGIAKFISNFSVRPCHMTQIPQKFAVSSPTLAPQKDMWLKVTKISK